MQESPIAALEIPMNRATTSVEGLMVDISRSSVAVQYIQHHSEEV